MGAECEARSRRRPGPGGQSSAGSADAAFPSGAVLFDKHPFHPDAPAQGEAPPPHNIEAEQALLGAMLADNDAFTVVDGLVSPRDFFEPFHQRLFKTIGDEIRHGRLAEPSLLAQYFLIDPAFQQFGGLSYLLDLLDKAPPSNRADQYAKAVRSVALRRDVVRIAKDIAHRAQNDAQADGGQMMADLERDILAVRTGKDDLSLQSWSEVSRAVVYGMDKPDERSLIKLGLAKIDKMLGGAEIGDLIVLGGRPGMGKSALAAVIARLVAQQGFGVAEINAEMTALQMGRRHLTDMAFDQYGFTAPFYRDIRTGDLSDEQRRIVAKVQHETEHLPLRLVKRTGLTLGRIRAMLMRQKMLWESMGIKLRLVIIDHVGLVTPDEGAGQSRNQDQTIVSGRLKEMADELGVVMLALAQLNRNVESRDDKRPMLSDLRDSGSWEQDADVVLGTYRDAYYARREREPKGDLKVADWMARCASPYIEAIGLKVREGDVGTAKLWASIGHNAIRDHAPDDMDPFAASTPSLFNRPQAAAAQPQTSGETL